MGMGWQSVYIYYNASWEQFIRECLSPLMATVNDDVEKYFFVRYFENGPHLRLRFCCFNGANLNITKQTIEYHLRNYLADCPSFREVERDTFVENNTLLWTEYLPEYSRYGGTDCINYAETNFYISSKVICDLISDNSNWIYSDSLVAALRMQLVYAIGQFDNSSDLIPFFRIMFFESMRFVFGALGKGWEPGFVEPEIMKLHESMYLKQRRHIVKEVELILNTGRNLESGALKVWHDSSVLMRRELAHLIRDGLVVIPNILDLQERSDSLEITRNYLMPSLFHMNNNRLGVANRDEGFVSYALLRSLEEIDAKITYKFDANC